jgi:hypothetical protein
LTNLTVQELRNEVRLKGKTYKGLSKAKLLEILTTQPTTESASSTQTLPTTQPLPATPPPRFDKLQYDRLRIYDRRQSNNSPEQQEKERERQQQLNLTPQRITSKKTNRQINSNKSSQINKLQYLKEFDSSKNGPLHEQKWVKSEMKAFHNKLAELKPLFCNMCHELWPSREIFCTTCSKHPGKFTDENEMKPGLDYLPSHIKAHFEQLTMIEEMLISPIASIMSIFRLPGGQLLSRGYVANFSQDISQLCTELPRKTKEIPILIVKRMDQENQAKEFKVNRYRVETLLRYLCENNPDWKKKGIKMNYQNLQSLPEDNIPTDINQLIDRGIQGETIDRVVTDTGPEILENDGVSTSEFEQAFVESDDTEPMQIDRIGQFISTDWPTINPQPINEFEYDGLASLCFPSLFPNGLGDPTKKSRIIEVSETDGFKHLLKYATIHTSSQELYYPFAQHPQFKFWAYDRLRRHRSLDQAKVYLKQNTG